jgi:hypothetical protein
MHSLTKIKENWMKLMRNLQAGDVTNCVVHISAIAFDFIGRTVKKKKQASISIYHSL